MTPPVTVVTGAAGFIGNALARRLHTLGREVIALDDFSSGRSKEVAPGLEVVDCDIRDREKLVALLPDKIDAVVHCAAQSSGEISFDDPWDDMTRHVHATMRLLEAAKERGTSHFVYASSMAAYGEPAEFPVRETQRLLPLSFYGAGKAAAENYVRIYCEGDMAFSIVRPFSVYGAGQDLRNLRQGMVSIYLAQLLRTGRIEVKGSLDRFRDFVHLDDAVDAFVSVLETSKSHGQTFNLCSGRPTTVREVLSIILDQVNAEWDVVEETAGTPGDQFGMYGSNECLKGLGNWSPRWTIRTGIADMWMRAKASERGA